MLDIDEVMEGFDLTTSPATNAGDPLAKKNVSTIVAAKVNMVEDEEKDAFGKIIINSESVESQLLKISKEQESDLDECLEYFKSDNCGDIVDILSNIM